MAEPAHRKLTVDEFLAWDDGTDRRYELVRGEIVGMELPSERHGTIVALLAAEIPPPLRHGCRVGVAAGIRLPHRDDTFYQADLAVTYVPAGDRAYLPDPVLIVEVLSPSTAQYDRGTKLPDYRELLSLQEILLVSAARRDAELWRRSGTSWIVSRTNGGTLRLDSIGIEVGLDAIYADAGIDN